MLDTEVDDVELSILIPVAVNGVMTRQYCVGTTLVNLYKVNYK